MGRREGIDIHKMDIVGGKGSYEKDPGGRSGVWAQKDELTEVLLKSGAPFVFAKCQKKQKRREAKKRRGWKNSTYKWGKGVNKETTGKGNNLTQRDFMGRIKTLRRGD